MKRATILLLVLLVGMVIGGFSGMYFGFNQGTFSVAIQENKTAAWNLRWETNLSPQLGEYLKARIYSNIRTYYPSDSGYLIQNEWDFGPVDRTILTNIRVFKDPEGVAWDWPNAITNK